MLGDTVALWPRINPVDEIMIELTCPHCGRHHQLDEESAGSRVTCHACGKKFKVPGVAKRSSAPVERSSTPDAGAGNPGSQDSRTQGSSTLEESVSPDSSKQSKPETPRQPQAGSDSGRVRRNRPSANHENTGTTQAGLSSDQQDALTPTSDGGPLAPLPAHFDQESSASDSPLKQSESPSAESHEVALDLDADEWNQFEATPQETGKVEGQTHPSLSSPPLGVDDPQSHDESSAQRWRGDEHGKRREPSSFSQGSSSDPPGQSYTSDSLPLEFEGEARPAQTGGDEIRVQCSICDSVTWVKPSKAGKKIVCTDCGTEVRVPEETLPLPPSLLDVPSTATPEKKSGWQLSQPIDRPRRDLPESLMGDPKSTPASLHVSKIKRWGEPEEEPQPSKEEPAAPQQSSSRETPIGDGPTVSEDPVGGHERPEWNEPKVFGVVEWLRDTVVIFRNVTMYGAAIAVAFVCGAFGTIAKAALLYSGAENGAIMRIVGMCSMLFSMPSLLLAATVLGAVLMTMIQDGASNAKEIGNWPELTPNELLPHCAPMYVTGFIAVTPGLILAEFVHLVDFGLWGFLVFPLLSGFVLTPPLVLSAFREQSMFAVYSGPVYASVRDFSAEWKNFFILCLGALFIAGICMIGIGLTPFVLDIPFWIAIGFLWVIYGRWIGILARRLAWLIPVDSNASQ